MEQAPEARRLSRLGKPGHCPLGGSLRDPPGLSTFPSSLRSSFLGLLAVRARCGDWLRQFHAIGISRDATRAPRAGAALMLVIAASLYSPSALADRLALPDGLADKWEVVRHLAVNPRLVRAVRRANVAPATTDKDGDADARAGGALAHALAHNPAGRLLALHVNGNSAFASAGLLDAQGTSVAAYPPTDSYDFASAPGVAAALAGKEDASALVQGTATVVATVVVPVTDGGAPIGALVVGFDPSFLRAAMRAGTATDTATGDTQ